MVIGVFLCYTTEEMKSNMEIFIGNCDTMNQLKKLLPILEQPPLSHS